MLNIKRYTIFAGVNGAGKSTLFGVYNSEDLGVRLNTDEIAKERVKKRIAMWHGVNDDTIDRRFSGAIENFKKIFPYCDTINMYDNSGISMELVATYIGNGTLKRNNIKCKWCDELIKELNN